ncbi:hypothetical protein EBU71_05755 [bacterium]|nr:hypothetical protein [Candidatus Elulimicrobium humile]
MALEDIEKKIYKKENQVELDKERVNNTQYSVYAKHDQATTTEFEPFEKAGLTFSQKYKKKITLYSIIAVSLVGIVLTIGFFFQLNQQRFSDRRVRLEITGNNKVSAGEELTYTLTYHNDNLVSLKNAKITVEVPNALIDSSLDILGQTKSEIREYELPELEPRSKGEIIIKGRLIGEISSIHTMKATLNYRPTILTSSFDSKTEFATTISDSPVVVDIQAPLESVSGEIVNYIITVNNKSNNDLKDLELQLEYPETFAFTSSTLTATGNSKNIFIIPSLRSKTSYELTIVGNLGGSQQEIKVLKAKIGESRQGAFTLYASSQKSTTLGSPYVNLTQRVNTNIAKAGETLEYTISFRNNTQVRIGEGFLKAQLDSKLLDLTKLNARGADFDSGTNTIIWRANAIPQLKIFGPNEQGEISFTVPIKRTIPIENFQDVNYVIKTNATFESNEVPTTLGVNKIIQGNSSEVKLSTRLIPKASIYYVSRDSSIINTGPLPLKVAQLTTFSVSLEIQNLTNDVSGVSFRTTLPNNVTWTGKTVATNGNITYNERTKEIVWNVDKVPANTGLLRPLYRAVFQIGITPAINQIGQNPQLLSRINYTGQDDFTGIDLSDILDLDLRDIESKLKVEE